MKTSEETKKEIALKNSKTASAMLSSVIDSPDLFTDDGQEAKLKVYHITKRYFKLCLACAADEELYKNLFNPANSLAFLTNGKKTNPEYIKLKKSLEDLLKQSENPNSEELKALMEKLENTEEFINVWTDEEGNVWPGCGMILPKNTQVIFDYDIRWPTLYLSSKEVHDGAPYIIKESPLLIEAYHSDDPMGHVKKIISYDDPQSFLTLPFTEKELNNSEITLMMPSYVPNVDMILEAKASDEEKPEIIMTCS